MNEEFEENEAKSLPTGGSMIGPIFIAVFVLVTGLTVFLGRDKLKDYFLSVESESSKHTVAYDVEPFDEADPVYVEMQKWKETYNSEAMRRYAREVEINRRFKEKARRQKLEELENLGATP